MHAKLCRLLTHSFSMLYYKREYSFIASQLNIDRPFRQYLIDEATKAYTLEKMHPLIQGFLQDCDRCWQIETQIQEDNPTLSLEQVQKRALAQLEKEQEEAFVDG